MDRIKKYINKIKILIVENSLHLFYFSEPKDF